MQSLFDLVHCRETAFTFLTFFPHHFSFPFLLADEFSFQVLAMFRAPKSLRNFLTSVKAPFRSAVYTYKKKQNYDPVASATGKAEGRLSIAVTFLCKPHVTRKAAVDTSRRDPPNSGCMSEH